MEPLKLSQAIEENILELFGWVYLFPITLVDLLIRPMTFLESMTIERSKTDDPRFDTRMPPVLFFLFGTVPLSIAVLKAEKMPVIIPQLTDVVLMLALVLAILPFVWALSMLAVSGRGFGKTAFREVFCTQCYLFCPPWLFVLISTLAYLNNTELLQVVSMVLFLGLTVWLLIVEWRLMRGISSLRKGILCFAAALVLSVSSFPMVIALAHAAQVRNGSHDEFAEANFSFHRTWAKSRPGAVEFKRYHYSK